MELDVKEIYPEWQISFVELKEVDIASFINKIINEGYVQKLSVRKEGKYLFSFYADDAEIFDKCMNVKIKGD